MLISYCSSDVCASDLENRPLAAVRQTPRSLHWPGVHAPASPPLPQPAPLSLPRSSALSLCHQSDRPKSCVAHPSPQQAAPRQHQPGVLSRNSHALRQILRDPNDQPFHEALAPHRPQPLRLRHQPFEHGSSSHLTVTRSPTRGSSSTKRTRNTRPPHRKRQSSPSPPRRRIVTAQRLSPRRASPLCSTPPRSGTTAAQSTASCAQTAALPPKASRTSSRRSEEHTSELQSLMRISYAVFCLKKKTQHQT